MKRALWGIAALIVMPGCGCGQHEPWIYNAWDQLNAGPFIYFSRGKWWRRRDAWAGWMIEKGRQT